MQQKEQSETDELGYRYIPSDYDEDQEWREERLDYSRDWEAYTNEFEEPE